MIWGGIMDKILVVEDNKIVNTTLSRLLQANDYEVDSVYTAEDALNRIGKTRYDLIILDLNLPQMNGYNFLRVLRTKSDIPVVINTAHSSVKARVKLIHAGASDFIEKSFSTDEILESIQIILDDRKKAKDVRRVFEYKDISIDFANRTVLKKKEVIELTNKEFDILKVLFDNPDKAFSRKQLYLFVWGEEYSEQVDNTINVHVKRLRNKIETDPKQPEFIETVYAFGYRLGKPIVHKLEQQK